MKKAVIALICVFMIAGPAFAKAASKDLKVGISQYKNGNYVGAMQTLQEVVAADAGNALAHYYLAISCVKVGKIKEAKQEYQTVMVLNPSSELAYNAAIGLKYLSSVTEVGDAVQNLPDGNSEMLPSPPELTPPGESLSPTTSPKSYSQTAPDKKEQGFISKQAQEKLLEHNLNSIINNVNQNGSVPVEKLKKIDNIMKQKSEAPSNEEIAAAVKTLSLAGVNVNLNSNQAANPYQNINPEMMQMNMMMGLMGGNQNSNMNSNPMNMLSMMMMQNPESLKNMDPKLMETMVSGMMMPNMFSLNNNNNDY